MSEAASFHAIEALFADVIAQAAPVREAYLQAHDAPEAVKNEVAALLRAWGNAPADADHAITGGALTLGGAQAGLPERAAAITGQRLGPWAVVREVGRGGMGAVFEAFRADDAFRKRVAVKMITRTLDRETMVRRFEQERQILAQLEHPGIARLIDGGVTDDGQPYLVMEFVDGEPIDAYCTRHALPLRERLDLFRQVCAAVQHAHAALVVHRDIKPGNILVTPAGDVKLVDFGIAKLLAGDGGSADITATQHRTFTTGYASPEQVQGRAVTTATDVYSLGVTLFQLLTDRLPFEPRDDAADILRRIVEEPAPAPSRVSQLPFARALAGELDDIVLVALRKEPDRRFATVATFSDDCKRYLQGQQVSARPDTWRYRIHAFSRRNPALVGGAALAVVSLGAGAIMASSQAQRATRARNAAIAEAARAARVVGFVEQMLAAPGLGVLSPSMISTIDGAMAQARSELAAEPLARAAVYRTAAKTFAYHSLVDRAAPLIDSALALDAQHAGNPSPELARDATVAALVAYARGQLDSAVTLASRAVTMLRARASDRVEDLSTALTYQSFALTYAGRPAEALPVAREGLRIERASPTSARAAYLHVAVGEAASFLGDAPTAVSEYTQAIRIYEQLPGEPPVERGIAELGMGNLLVGSARVAESEQHARRALAILERQWGVDHAYTGRAHALLAVVAVRRQDRATATRELAAAEQARAHNPMGLLDWAVITMDVARAQFAAGQREASVRLLEGALRERGDELRHAPFVRAYADLLLGQAQFALRRWADAHASLEAAHSVFAALYGEQNSFARQTAPQVLLSAAAGGDSVAVARAARHVPPDSVQSIVTRGRAMGMSR